MAKIKQPQQANATQHIKPPDNIPKSTNDKSPLFSLSKIQKSYCLSACKKDEKAAFADQLHHLSRFTWSQIQSSPKLGAGHEKIARDSIKASIPSFVTEDVNFLAFRFMGKAPMVGYRQGEVFFILWIDRDFTLYQH